MIMHTTTCRLLILLLASIHCLRASEPPLGELSRAVLGLFPDGEDKAELKLRSSRHFLEIHYRTREFLVHGKSMTGKISEKANKTMGPSYVGVLFTISALESDDVIQAGTPRVLREPYWSTYINRLDFEDYSLFYGVQYGSRTDKKLTQSIINKLNSLPGQVSSSKGGR